MRAYPLSERYVQARTIMQTALRSYSDDEQAQVYFVAWLKITSGRVYTDLIIEVVDEQFPQWNDLLSKVILLM